jgi:pSer/pThr/pTyr-binding forkhead associated (FHA) protein
MQRVPVIVVQLVHIEGPLKGEILEFSQDEILIGRHPDCHLAFPRDLDIISRKHARIVREGNRFKIVDQSTNGTYVNGKPVQESYLKIGDVLMIADGGPKVSFLTKIMESEPTTDMPPASQPAPTVPPQHIREHVPVGKPSNAISPPPAPSTQELLIEKTQVPLVIQYGPTLRSFKKLPVTIGKSSGCDVIMNYPAIHDLHAEIFFSRNQYWIKDRTGQNQVSVDGTPLQQPVPLAVESRIALSPQGPTFRFLAGGRLAEIEDAKAPPPEISSPLPDNANTAEKDAVNPPKGAGGILKKIFK